MTIENSARPLRELAYRTNAGLAVTLLWDPVEDQVLLRVDDMIDGTSVELEPHPGNERFAYEHPFAFLASRHP